jgi:hypothetical protein
MTKHPLLSKEERELEDMKIHMDNMSFILLDDQRFSLYKENNIRWHHRQRKAHPFYPGWISLLTKSDFDKLSHVYLLTVERERERERERWANELVHARVSAGGEKTSLIRFIQYNFKVHEH